MSISVLMIFNGVSGSGKTNEIENPNWTKLKKYPTLLGSVWNRSEPIETDLIWFGSWFFISRSVKPMNQSDDNHTPYFTNIILPHTNLWLCPKLKSNIKYFLIHSLSLIFISSHQLDSFIFTIKKTLAVNHAKPIVHGDQNFIMFKFQDVLISVCMDLIFWLCFNFRMFFLEFLCLLMNDACMDHGWLKYLSLMKLFLKNDGWMNLGSYVWNIEKG